MPLKNEPLEQDPAAVKQDSPQEPVEIETTDICPSCNKVIYKRERCSCTKK